MGSTAARATSPQPPVAPTWHIIVVLLAVAGLSVAGARSGGLPALRAHGRPAAYALVMVFEWAMVAFIGYGVRRRGLGMIELVGGRWLRPRDVLRDLAVAIGFLLISQFVLGAVGHLLKAAPNPAIRSLLPRSQSEVILFLLLTLTAGFCEEVIFRGYLQRQFAALTGDAAGGIVLQGIAFGAAHGYQGWKYMVVIAVFGTLFGVLAHWRRSLRPGMIAHFLQDGVGGLVARHVLR